MIFQKAFGRLEFLQGLLKLLQGGIAGRFRLPLGGDIDTDQQRAHEVAIQIG